MQMTKYDVYELIDEIGQAYYRWDTEKARMEWWVDGQWKRHDWTPRSLRRYAETYDDATLNVVTEDDVR
jgi:hypothetical protein